MASERAAMQRQQQKLRQGSSGPPARHARFGGLFVRRYNAEDRGSVVRSNPLASDLPAIPELKKSSKTLVRPHWPPLLPPTAVARPTAACLHTLFSLLPTCSFQFGDSDHHSAYAALRTPDQQ